MTCTSLGCALLGFAMLVGAGAGCSDTPGTGTPGADGGTRDAASEASTVVDGGAGSISCYTDVQFTCEEKLAPTTEQEDALKVVCSSGSGAFAKPAACPPAGFLGKCSITEGKEVTVRRYYKGPGVDIAYQEDFCVNTAHGVWSTTF